jgi:hypothetical protein
MKFFTYACLILGAAAINLRQTSTLQADSQLSAGLRMGMAVSAGLTSFMQNKGDDDLEAQVKADLEKAFADDGELSWPEAEAIIRKYMPHIIEAILDHWKQQGATAEDIANARAYYAAHKEDVDNQIVGWFHDGFMKCDADKNGKLSGEELDKCVN